MVADATAAFAGPFWNQLGLPTPFSAPCKRSLSASKSANCTAVQKRHFSDFEALKIDKCTVGMDIGSQ